MDRIRAIGFGAAGITGVALAGRAMGRGPLAELDKRILTGVVARRRDGWVTVARYVTECASPPAVCGAVAVAAVRCAMDGGSLRRIVTVVGSAGAGIAVRRVMAETIRRPRPPQAWWQETPHGYSYPSRHVSWAALGYAAALDLLQPSDSHLGRWSVMGLVGAIGATRLVLAVHWPSDVVAAAAFGAAWRRLSAG